MFHKHTWLHVANKADMGQIRLHWIKFIVKQSRRKKQTLKKAIENLVWMNYILQCDKKDKKQDESKNSNITLKLSFESTSKPRKNKYLKNKAQQEKTTEIFFIISSYLPYYIHFLMSRLLINATFQHLWHSQKLHWI